jgi:hypothetical protein
LARGGGINLLLTIRAEPALDSFSLPCAAGAARGQSMEQVMSGRQLQAGADLLSAFAIMIGGAFGVGLSMALVIIWVCS